MQDGGPAPGSPLAPQTTGGPDHYGYTWNDGVPYNWIDTAAGTTLPLSSQCGSLAPVPIGFPFKYYENTYTTAYVGYAGFVASAQYSGCWYQKRVPTPGIPRDAIVPYSGNFADSQPGHVRYLAGGAAPNRYLVIEWNQVPDRQSNSTYTFEVILYESGDITFQYRAMNYTGSWACAGVGIEDSQGTDGLNYAYCSAMPNGRAVRFTRPAPSARVKVDPLYQGRFVHPAEAASFTVPLRNNGELGADVYEVTASSPWSVSLYRADGVTPLSDSNGNGTPDTGSVAQGTSANVVARVQTPANVAQGASNAATVSICSHLNPAKCARPVLRTAVPTSFVQAFRDAPGSAMSLLVAVPGGQAEKATTGAGTYGEDPALAGTSAGNFVYVWSQGRCNSANCAVYTYEITYELVNRFGQRTYGPARLVDNSGATFLIHDEFPSVAVAPDGRIGITWLRFTWDSLKSQYNYNVYFAILGASGTLAYGPVNVTGNPQWGSSSAVYVPGFYYPHVAASDDNRFVVAWEQQQRDPFGNYLSDLYYMVRNTAGAAVKPATRLTGGAFGGDGYFTPYVTRLAGSRALVTFRRTGNNDNDIYFAVLSSAGDVVKGMTNLSGDGKAKPDSGTAAAAQLSDGRIAVAWTFDNTPAYQMIRYATLDAAYNRIAGPATLNNPAGVGNDSCVSVVADKNGRAALSWTDDQTSSRRWLYYALIDGGGALVTAPTIYHTSPSIATLYTDCMGNSAAAYNAVLPPVDGAISAATLAGAQPGRAGALSVRLSNHAGSAGSGTLTATLANNLTYAGDTLGVAPTVSGNTVVWHLPEMPFLYDRSFILWLRPPLSAAIGTRFNVTLDLAMTSADVNEPDNHAASQVMAARQTYAPRTSLQR